MTPSTIAHGARTPRPIAGLRVIAPAPVIPPHGRTVREQARLARDMGNALERHAASYPADCGRRAWFWAKAEAWRDHYHLLLARLSLTPLGGEDLP